jgi:hypothetical protein
MKLIDTNFSVKIECTDKSQRVIDWFNNNNIKDSGAWEVMKGYGIIENKKRDWEGYEQDVPKDCEILTETEFLKRLQLEEAQNINPDNFPVNFNQGTKTDYSQPAIYIPNSGDMVEVSDGGFNWYERKFYQYDSKLNYPYIVFIEEGSVNSWKHRRTIRVLRNRARIKP